MAEINQTFNTQTKHKDVLKQKKKKYVRRQRMFYKYYISLKTEKLK